MSAERDNPTLTNIVPVIADESSREFFDAARRGQLLLHRTTAGEVVAPQEAAALDGLTPFVASGRGSVVTSSVVFGRDESGQSVPRYTIGVVELDEGPWLWTELILPDGGTNADVLTGRSVVVRFVPSGTAPEHEFVPVFMITD